MVPAISFHFGCLGWDIERVFDFLHLCLHWAEIALYPQAVNDKSWEKEESDEISQ